MTDWICELTDKERESFLTFAKQSSSPIQIYLYSRFMGYTGSIVDCDEWVKSKFKKRNFAAFHAAGHCKASRRDRHGHR
jgi:hypothetical protein